MKTGLKRRAAALAMAAALMLALIPTVLPMEAKASVVVDIAVEKLVAMSETGLSKIIAGADHACGDDKVSSFVNTWFFEDAGTAQTVERIEELCEEILDRLDELEDQISRETSQIEKMIAEATASAALNNLNNAWKTQVEDQIPTDIADAVEVYQAYFRAARQYGINPIQANRDRKDAAREELRDALVDVYQAETNSYNANATDLDPAMKTTAADSRFDDCMKDLIRQLNTGTYNVTDYAAMAAYQCLVFADDQYAFIDSYMQKQLLTAGWVLLTYNELMAMQGEYIDETYGGSDEYGGLMDRYAAAKQDMESVIESLLEESAELMDRQITFSSLSPRLRLTEMMKPEDNLVVSLRNDNYYTQFPVTKVMEEDAVDDSLLDYLDYHNSFCTIMNPNNPAVRTGATADFELAGVLAAEGTAFYYIMQAPFLLQELEYKFNVHDGSINAPDVHAPSCDWYNLRDWSFSFPSSNAEEDVKAFFSRSSAMALNGNTALYALGEHSPADSPSAYIFTPDYRLPDERVASFGTSYARITFLEATEPLSDGSVPAAELSAESMQADGGSRRNDQAIYMVKRTDENNERTVHALTSGSCELKLGVEKVGNVEPNYGSSVKQRFGNYISIKCRATGDETLSNLCVKRYLDSDKSRYTLEVIADDEIFGILTPDEQGYYYLLFPMPACDADIWLTTAGETPDDTVTPGDFQQQKERLTALEKDAAVRTADVIAGSVSAQSVTSLKELLAQDAARTKGALSQLLDDTDAVSAAKAAYDSGIAAMDNARIKAAYTKLSNAWQYKVAGYTDPFAGALDAFRTYVSCLSGGTDCLPAEEAYVDALNALAGSGDFRTDPTLNISVEKALANLIFSCTLLDETRVDPDDRNDDSDDPAFVVPQLASLSVQAARTAYETYPFTHDQREMINTYVDAQSNEIAWLLLMYQDIVSRQDPQIVGLEGYPAHLTRLTRLFLAGLESAMDSDMTFWADMDTGRVVTIRLSAYPAAEDVRSGSEPLEFRFRDEGWLSEMGFKEWDDMKEKGYELHYNDRGSQDSKATDITEYNSFYVMPVLAGHAVGVAAPRDLQFFQALSAVHPLKNLEYKNNVSMTYDNHLPSTDYFNLMAQGYAEDGGVRESGLNKLALTQAFVNSGSSLKTLVSPFVSTELSGLYLLVEPDTNGNPKVQWEGRNTKYVMLPMVYTGKKAIDAETIEYMSSEDFQSSEQYALSEYMYLRKADHGRMTVKGAVTNPGRNGESVIEFAYDSAGYDPSSSSIWKDSLTVDPGTSVHLRINPGDGQTVNSLAVQRYTKEDAPGTVTSTQVIADQDDFRYLEKDENGWYHLEVTVPYSWVDVSFAAQTSYSSGGGSGGASAAATYQSTLRAQPVNGTVSLVRASALRGEQVVITPTAEAGYELDTISVLDSRGDPVEVINLGDGTYAFIQPDSNVTVSVTFRPRGTEEHPSAGRFKDVSESAWYCQAVEDAADKGLMNGVSADTFDPDGAATRAMAVTILWRMAGQPAASGPAPFTDVSGGAWYAGAVAWAAENGVVKGTSETTFSPNDPVTREQLAAILYRYARSLGEGFAGAWTFPLDFTDADRVSDYAREALCWMTMNGVITGMGDGALAPRDNATRAQIAAIFLRFSEALEK